MDNLNRDTSCCFTGHRPEKLARTEAEVRAALKTAILEAFNAGYNTFITGMAQGVDTWAGEEVIGLKNSGADVFLVCAIPYKAKTGGWQKSRRDEYERLINAADSVVYISDDYYMGVHQRRDRWMVDNSARVIAVYDGAPGGTRWTVNYARSEGAELVLL